MGDDIGMWNIGAYPPMQRGASFNLDAIKAEMAKRMAEAEAAAKGFSN